jgi:hypothetical protein
MVRFSKAGTYDYRCLYHDGMIGHVVVGSGGATPSPSTSSTG